MKILDAKAYDPAGAVTKSAASLLAMTALDTTNLRCSFSGPPSGVVMVRARFALSGAVTFPTLLLGVLDGGTVKFRQAPIIGRQPSSANASAQGQIQGLVAVTPGTSYNWDLAYGVEVAIASSAIKYGGPNNSTANDAFGAICFEVWDAVGLLASKHYDPAVAVASQSMATAIAMVALDTTNLRCTFTAPYSGLVVARIRGVISGTTGVANNWFFGVLDGATVRCRMRPSGGPNQNGTLVSSDQIVGEVMMPISGLTGGTSYNFDAAVGVESGGASSLVKYGGPDDTTTDNAWGGFSIDIWDPASVNRVLGGVI